MIASPIKREARTFDCLNVVKYVLIKIPTRKYMYIMKWSFSPGEETKMTFDVNSVYKVPSSSAEAEIPFRPKICCNI